MKIKNVIIVSVLVTLVGFILICFRDQSTYSILNIFYLFPFIFLTIFLISTFEFLINKYMKIKDVKNS